MGRSDDIDRMDLATDWWGHHRTRDLVRRYPTDWPTYWCAYLLVLGDSWRRQQRVRLADAWPPGNAMPCGVQDALAALVAVGLLDRYGRIRQDSWNEWAGPALARIAATRAAASKAARTRWDRVRGVGSDDQSATPQPKPPRKPRTPPGGPPTVTGGNAAAHAAAHATAIPKPSQSQAYENGASAPLRAQDATAPDDHWRDGLPHLSTAAGIALVHQAEQLVGMTFLQAGAKVPTALDQLTERHGVPAVGAALAAVAQGMGGTYPSWPQLVYGARNLLEPIPGGKPQAPADPAPDPQAAAKRERARLRHMAYLRGELTEAQHAHLRDIDGVP